MRKTEIHAAFTRRHEEVNPPSKTEPVSTVKEHVSFLVLAQSVCPQHQNARTDQSNAFLHSLKPYTDFQDPKFGFPHTREASLRTPTSKSPFTTPTNSLDLCPKCHTVLMLQNFQWIFWLRFFRCSINSLCWPCSKCCKQQSHSISSVHEKA